MFVTHYLVWAFGTCAQALYTRNRVDNCKCWWMNQSCLPAIAHCFSNSIHLCSMSTVEIFTFSEGSTDVIHSLCTLEWISIFPQICFPKEPSKKNTTPANLNTFVTQTRVVDVFSIYLYSCTTVQFTWWSPQCRVMLPVRWIQVKWQRFGSNNLHYPSSPGPIAFTSHCIHWRGWCFHSYLLIAPMFRCIRELKYLGCFSVYSS